MPLPQLPFGMTDDMAKNKLCSMCVNQYLTHNIYTGRDLYVKCGKCPACLQEKAAHRLSRIKTQ